MANTMGGGWNNPDYGFDPQGMMSGAGGFLGGLFGDSGKSYDKAMEQYQKYMQMGQGVQQPYLDAGKEGLGNYQEWLKGQKDPSGFINNLMGNYQESPYAHMLQQQAMNAGNNSASASGMMGSSALMQQQQQNAGQIASGDMNSWLQNVLGINSQYGQGEDNLMKGGQGAANSLTDMYNKMGHQMGEAAYGKEAGKKNDFWNTIGGGLSMRGSFL
jgi:hypothetical protein